MMIFFQTLKKDNFLREDFIILDQEQPKTHQNSGSPDILNITHMCGMVFIRCEQSCFKMLQI